MSFDTEPAEIEGLFTVENNRHSDGSLWRTSDQSGPRNWSFAERSCKMDEVSAGSRSDGEFIGLKAVAQHLWTFMASMIRKRTYSSPTAYRYAGWIWFFQKPKTQYRQNLWRYKRLRKQVVEPSVTSRKIRPVLRCWSFNVEIEAVALEAGWGPAGAERQRLLNHKMIADTLTNAYTMLDAEEFSSLSNVQLRDLKVSQYDPSYKEPSGQLSETFYALGGYCR